jgi:uncharacterized protein
LNRNPEAAWLLDVNALIALIDINHVHNDAMQQWFARNSSLGWSTCPLTENGVVRVLTLPGYKGGSRTASEVVRVLQTLKETQGEHYRFWEDDISLCDGSLFRLEYLSSNRHLTDLYLLGVAFRHGARFVSFDRNLPWQAVRGATAGLIESPA